MHKKVIGYSFAKTIDAELIVSALDKAYVNQRPERIRLYFTLNLKHNILVITL